MSELGTVTDVTIDGDPTKIYVDVSLDPNRHPQEIAFRSPGAGIWVVPEEGDIVEVDKVGNGQRVAHTPHNIPSAGPPAGLGEGDIAIRLNESTLLHFENTGSGYDVRLECDGELSFLANQIYVGDKSNATKVATADHTHDFTYDGGGDNSSTLSGTTAVENENATNTEVE